MAVLEMIQEVSQYPPVQMGFGACLMGVFFLWYVDYTDKKEYEEEQKEEAAKVQSRNSYPKSMRSNLS